MRSIHAAGFLLALTFGASVGLAQTTTTPEAPTVPAAPSQPTAVSRGHRHGHYGHLLRGMQLTADQQTKIAALRSQHRTEARGLHQQMGTARATLRAAKAGTDATAVETARTQMRAVHAQFATMRSQWLSETRAVLTPEQQSQFDANVAAARASRHARQQS
jgi:Spy/CpxP family protein refolding chaperone